MQKKDNYLSRFKHLYMRILLIRNNLFITHKYKGKK